MRIKELQRNKKASKQRKNMNNEGMKRRGNLKNTQEEGKKGG